MKILITIPHVFAPQEGSLYSSQTEGKRVLKQQALWNGTIGNLNRHGKDHLVHASLGRNKPVVNRRLKTEDGLDIRIQLYTPADATLSSALPSHQSLEIIDPDVDTLTEIPLAASKRLLEQSQDYDIVGYMEDDILIEDPHFFQKLSYLFSFIPDCYALMPHRCEMIPGQGDVILSGDPDGGRPDLFWATNETIEVQWPTGNRRFYRATNPHSGCYFLSRQQALKVAEYWRQMQWKSDFVLSGPLEQAASGLLLPVLKVMKPVPEHYRFLMVRHQDELWKRHQFE